MRSWAVSVRVSATATLAVLCAVAAHAAGTAESYASARKEFQEAYANVVSANSADTDSKALKSYPLYPYLEAERIREALSREADPLGPADRRAEDFLAEHEPLPVARGLRRAWLDSLARRSQWGQFLEAYRDAGASVTTRCQSFAGRIALGKTEGLARAIAKQWLTPRSLPDCKSPFDWMKENGVLTLDLIERRARLSLENGNAPFARQLIQLLPAVRAAPLAQWAALLENPERSIDALMASPSTPVDAEALLAGWSRFVRMDAAAAKGRYTDFVRTRGLSRESVSPYALALALQLARDRDPAAPEYFELVAASDLDDPAREWRARAALWSKDWKRAAQLIETLSEPRRQAARWRYWSARTAEQLGRSEEARRIYESLLEDDNYYSAMAAGRLKRSVAPRVQSVTADPQLLTTMERLPALERARELFLCGMRQQAAAEWRLGYESLSEDARLQSIRLASGWGWYDLAIAVATQQGVFNDYELLYPRPFTAEVRAAARLAQLRPEIVYGVVRQESLYRIDAVSNAGAMGLMQLQLGTARHTARQWKRPRPTRADLFDASKNTTLGAAYLRILLDRFEGQLPVALAGYNSGPNAAMRWLPTQAVDADIWIENIPYSETREYVQRVLWHSLLFTWLREGRSSQQTDSWLLPVRALGNADESIRVVNTE